MAQWRGSLPDTAQVFRENAYRNQNPLPDGIGKRLDHADSPNRNPIGQGDLSRSVFQKHNPSSLSCREVELSRPGPYYLADAIADRALHLRLCLSLRSPGALSLHMPVRGPSHGAGPCCPYPPDKRPSHLQGQRASYHTSLCSLSSRTGRATLLALFCVCTNPLRSNDCP
ncbi:hypothetical protein ES703_109209 [subsurface metagenome]